jgi:FtsP/CotA-like multicopper oxidase with cupredoxin domain
MVIVNNHGGMSHPLHQHGHHFLYLGSGAKYAGDFPVENASTILNWENPIMRDTIQIQDYSWVAFFFKAEQPWNVVLSLCKYSTIS